MRQQPEPLAKRSIRRHQLRELVPLADTKICDMEQRGEFPQRFYLTSRYHSHSMVPGGFDVTS